MEIYKSDYCIMHFDASQILEFAWFPKTSEMTPEIFKHDLLEYKRLVIEHQAKKVLVNVVELGFCITLELQSWVDKTIHEDLIREGLSRIAIVVSKNIFTQTSVEQTLSEQNATLFLTQYFDNVADARTWLHK